MTTADTRRRLCVQRSGRRRRTGATGYGELRRATGAEVQKQTAERARAGQRRRRVVGSDEDGEAGSDEIGEATVEESERRVRGRAGSQRTVRERPEPQPKRKAEEAELVSTDASEYFAASNKVSRSQRATRQKSASKTNENIRPIYDLEDENVDVIIKNMPITIDCDDEQRVDTDKKRPDQIVVDQDTAVPSDVTPKRLKLSESKSEPAERTSKRSASAASPATQASPRRKVSHTKSSPVKKEQVCPSDNVQAILDSVPIAELPNVGLAETKDHHFATRRDNTGPPPAIGSKDLPIGQENCLAGLTFVFTGLLQSLDREEGQNLVKKYGGKVTSAPSSKTSFVVLGESAGPKKIETIRKNNLRTIDEDGLFQLIRTLPANGGSGKLAEIASRKRAVEEAKIIEMAKEMTRPQVEEESVEESQLWTEKYAPQRLKDLCGNQGVVEKLQRWLRNWHAAARTNFKKPGPEGLGVYRGVIISGPPGIGKTTAAHLVVKMEGFDRLEFNASDTRSEKLICESLRGVIDNQSISGFFGVKSQLVDSGKKRLVLIMDEVDGMSAGDRGGVGAMTALMRKTKIPIICICNDRKNPKMRPFDRVALDINFRRPEAARVRARIMSIAYKEGLKLTPNVVDQLVASTQSDIRQVLNILSTYRLRANELDFDQGQKITKSSEKHITLKPWDIAGRLLSGGLFSATSKASLNDKIELYFHDHEFAPLMIQENYLRTRPSFAQNAGTGYGKESLKLAEKAAASISDGDLVDTMIHGSEQHWSLMPTHAVFSCVKPASYVAGGATGPYVFTSWLGQNSKGQKLSRSLREIHAHMRLRVSGNRENVRLSYVPVLFDTLAVPLAQAGIAAIDSIIEVMDQYYLTREDWDAILELGLGSNDGEKLLKRLTSATKAAYTRRYNSMSHPVAFSKASDLGGIKVGSKRGAPDLEDALEEEEADVDDEEETEDKDDLLKDKLVKAKKPVGQKARSKTKRS